MTEEELLAIEARAKAATGGKWWVDNGGDDVWGVGDSPSPLTGASYPIAQNIIDAETSDFIAHAGGDSGDVLRLVAEVRRLREIERDIAAVLNASPGMGWSGRGDNYPPMDIWGNLRRLQDTVKSKELEGRG